MNKWIVGLAAACLALLLMTVYLWRSGRHAADAASRQFEAEKLRANGVIVAEQEKSRTLKNDLDKLLLEDADLRKAWEILSQKTDGKLTPQAVLHGTTGPLIADGPARQPKPKPVSVPVIVSVPTENAQEPKKVEQPAEEPEEDVCLLAKGDKVEIRVDEIVAKTKANNLVFAGTAACWRLEPGPVAPIAKGPFNSSTTFDTVVPPPPPGWGGGLYFGLNQGGAILGPAVAAPPLKLFSWQLDATAGAGVNLTGAWGLGVTLIVR